MKLYMVPLAPNPVKVMLYLSEREALGVDFGLEQIIVNTLKGRHKEPEHIVRNPFGTLPVLELDDGRFICESRAIIDYLEDAFPEHQLFSNDINERALERDMERICDVRLAEHLAHWVHVFKSPLGWEPNPERAQELENRMQPALNYMNDALSDGRPFLCGAQVTVADCTLQAALNFMRFTGHSLISSYEHVAHWDVTYCAREPVARILNPRRA